MAAILPLPSLLVPRAEATRRIKKQIREGTRLIDSRPMNQGKRAKFLWASRQWQSYTRELLARTFTNERFAEEFEDTSDLELLEAEDLRDEVSNQKTILAECVNRLGELVDKLDLVP